MEQQFTHQPVLLSECMDALAIRPDGVYIDGTLGRGGHSEEIAKRLNTGRLICIDRDQAAIEAGRRRLAPYGEKVQFVHGNFQELGDLLEQFSIPPADGMLFDLGVSSPQLDEAARGFSYMADAPLDMRMDQSQTLGAWDVVNTWPQEKLKQILYTYGEERYAPQIAAAIVRRRAEKPIETTGELAAVIRHAMPPAALREKQHPAKRSFQAIRIAVNDELTAVEEMLPAAVAHLNPGGRIAVISFHSLEDRIVKTTYQSLAKGCICPPDFPVCVCGRKPSLKIITRKPIMPGRREEQENPRARSAKLRVGERI
ncbi:MAG: 16S rRNA (cytosine(1402)-N(4))-methyltransferase RsmH [Oscillospiraceae bacterium]|nr:16S rRNA (cytosine(1402)-N(4))-methyltransferase RsmH [Oscillospiraceae bacterium]